MSPTPEQEATVARVRAARDTIDDLSNDVDVDMLAELDRAEAQAKAQGVTVEPWDHGIDRQRSVERDRDERTR
jgi:hypothetical protein